MGVFNTSACGRDRAAHIWGKSTGKPSVSIWLARSMSTKGLCDAMVMEEDEHKPGMDRVMLILLVLFYSQASINGLSDMLINR
jgi:hypothetical protein